MAAMSLAGCGAPPKAVVPVQKFVVTSVAECVAMAGATEADCSGLFDAAVSAHTSKGTNYINRRLCEAAEGPDLCERLEEKVWRPKPQAFLVVRQGPATNASALYAGKDKTLVFRTVDATLFDPDKPEGTEFSPTAMKRLEGFGRS